MLSGRQLDEIKVRANEDNECLHSDCRVQPELDEVNAMKVNFQIAERLTDAASTTRRGCRWCWRMVVLSYEMITLQTLSLLCRHYIG